jgi:predicted ArsR family transcriptional regulator
LHVVDEQDFDYEYFDLLLKIQKDIQLIIDKDIVVKFAEKISRSNNQNEDSTKKESFISKLNELLKLFLFENEYIARKKSISEALFMKNQRKKMLKYHDNYDVFSEERFLK